MRVPDSAMGEDGYCVHCGARIRVRTWNTEREIQSEAAANSSDPGNAEPQLGSASAAGQLGSAASNDADTTPAPEPNNEVNLFFEEEAPEAPPPLTASSLQPPASGLNDVALFTAPEQPAVTPLAPRAITATCARCGRPFRGDWDRFRTSKGTVCYICANVLRSEEGEHIAQLEEEKARPVDPALGQSWDRLEAETARLQAMHNDKKSRNQQMAALAVIFAIVAVAVLLWPSSEPTSENARRHAAIRASAETEMPVPAEAPRWTRPVLASIRLAATLIGGIIALYLTLNACNKLPNETFKANLLAVGAVGTLFFIIEFVLMPFLSAPMIGWLAHIILLVILLKGIYDFTVLDFLYYILFGMVTRVLVWVIVSFATGLLGLAVT